jgi:RNA polymerase sigma-70 factor (ECF subfamily)
VEAAVVGDRRVEFNALFADEARFRAWYDAAARRLYAYLLSRCGGDPTLAEELTQQAFLHAVRHRDAYDGRADPITWLIAIGRNVLLDHVRRIDRQERLGLRLIVREIVPESDGAAAWQRDDREITLAVLRQLPIRQRTALVLHYVDGYSTREIANELGTSVGAVEQLLNRGRESFRRLFEEAAGHE